MKTIKEPKSYLSTNDKGYTYSVIYAGSCLCANTTKERALSTARGFKLEIEVVWDGIKGEFHPLEK